jgi:hypothetical protein
MSEPTIDAMLAWLDSRSAPIGCTNTQLSTAIRAILEQHRLLDGMVDDILKHPPHDNLTEAQWRIHEVTILRAFVERVEKRIEKIRPYQEADTSRNAMKAELALMEAEVKE